MPSTRSDQTGLKPTRYACYIGFYDLSPLQGRLYGSLLKITGLSHVTHVGPIISTKTQGDITLTVCAAVRSKVGIKSIAKVHSPETLEKAGGRLLAKIPIGDVEMDLDDAVRQARQYTDMTGWDLIFYHFIGRFLGLTRPRTCTTFVCHLFNLPEIWHPSTMWRHYDNTAIGWTGQGR